MKHVLLPIDGSTRSLRTIDMVQQTYRPQDTEVTLLMVLPDQMHIDGQFARDRMARKAAQKNRQQGGGEPGNVGFHRKHPFFCVL